MSEMKCMNCGTTDLTKFSAIEKIGQTGTTTMILCSCVTDKGKHGWVKWGTPIDAKAVWDAKAKYYEENNGKITVYEAMKKSSLDMIARMITNAVIKYAGMPEKDILAAVKESLEKKTAVKESVKEVKEVVKEVAKQAYEEVPWDEDPEESEEVPSGEAVSINVKIGGNKKSLPSNNQYI